MTLYEGKEYELLFVTMPANESAFVASAQDVFDSWEYTYVASLARSIRKLHMISHHTLPQETLLLVTGKDSVEAAHRRAASWVIQWDWGTKA